MQPLIHKIAARLQSWKGKLLHKAGWLTLVRSVLTSVPIYFLTVFALKKWALERRIDSVRRSFLWKGEGGCEWPSGDHSLVAWKKVLLPKQMGRLGVLDLQAFRRALQLR